MPLISWVYLSSSLVAVRTSRMISGPKPEIQDTFGILGASCMIQEIKQDQLWLPGNNAMQGDQTFLAFESASRFDTDPQLEQWAFFYRYGVFEPMSIGHDQG